MFYIIKPKLKPFEPEGPGGIVFFSIFLIHIAVFLFFSLIIFRLQESYLYNDRIWGPDGQENFDKFNLLMSYLAVKYFVILFFYSSELRKLELFRVRILEVIEYECYIFGFFIFGLFILANSTTSYFLLISSLLFLSAYFYYFKNRSSDEKHRKIKFFMYGNSAIAIVLLALIFPFI